MAVKNEVAVYIDGINRTPNAVMPIKFGNFLDERLDECRLSLRAINVKDFPPLTPVEILVTCTNSWNGTVEKVEEETTYYIVANDDAEEVLIGQDIYNHDLYLIEVTKVSECYVVDTLTYTNDLGRNYANNDALADPVWE